ncbi:Asp23/Gls24 family envelope stress response protein [Chengkuizengella axinellae]|uniref:Asp23/Gls24 family envelope stress response protein n=1 Tax=Chengkuizengella axinellae TaxID=3064388 RepID=A0ABT9IX38_9BACL|nr:Asp23/Gls24 family envelope stress response protein [Chengkuizengella sp. 2205SS18-9]MDP5273374.1 Asp23/Gls24 family envelope stress response protein [Chengkuizengella sp. 2205SS18-9]
MTIQLVNEYGKVMMNSEVISTLAGAAALDCYGLVGMASRSQLKDGITELLGRDNLSKGVEIRQEDSQENGQENEVHIDLYIIVSYGTKISEVAHNIQNKVKYVLNDLIGLEVHTVNIYVQGVRVSQ